LMHFDYQTRHSGGAAGSTPSLFFTEHRRC
jgi:hypothetical protein